MSAQPSPEPVVKLVDDAPAEKLQPQVVPARAPGAVLHLVTFAAAATAAFFLYGLIA
jgi:hypothetical protein